MVSEKFGRKLDEILQQDTDRNIHQAMHNDCRAAHK